MTARGPATVAMVGGTFASVLGSTILNVPIRDISRDLHVTIAAASLLITTAGIAFATFLPLAGWVGSRLGRRNFYCAAVAALGLAGIVSLFAHDLWTLVAMRIVQGVAAAMIVPVVMTLLTDLYEPERRAVALSAWATANSLGQALGPPLGGILTSTLGWRATFAPVPVICLATCIATLRYVPADRPQAGALDWRGALDITLGALALQVAFAALPQVGLRSPLPPVLALVGIAFLIDFARAIRTSPQPFVSPRAFREPSWVASSIGIFGATVCFGAALLATPLYLIGVLRFPTIVTGFIALALPLAMSLCAPLTSNVVRRRGSKRTLQVALAVLAAGAAAIALEIASGAHVAAVIVSLLVCGAAIAFAYTSAAVGSTQSQAGRIGAAVGLFNLLRIAGSAIGAAAVALTLELVRGGYATIFALVAAIVAASFVATMFSRERDATPVPRTS